jgi:alpha-D-ribose 1-methylphosphonate 5-triphosphate synthase subunit PhnG
VVIDSWDAIASQMGGKKNEMFEASITQLVRGNETKLILVSETLGTTSRDFIVDGVVTLKRPLIDYRRVRELKIKKRKKAIPFYVSLANATQVSVVATSLLW